MLTALGLLAVVLLIAANGYFVAAEFAFVAARRGKFVEGAEQGDKKSARALDVHQQLSFMLSGAQLGITVTSLVVGFIAEPAIAGAIEPVLETFGVPESASFGIAFATAFVLATVAQMVFGELAPKNLAITKAEPVARVLAPSTWMFMRVARPFIRLFDGSANRLLRAFGIEPVDELHGSVSADELDLIVDSSAEFGSLSVQQAALLDRAIDFAELDASDAMEPWNRVVTIEATATAADLRELMQSTHSRFPVLDADGAIHGIVHAKDLLGVPMSELATTLVDDFDQPVLVVPEAAKLRTVLYELRLHSTEMAIVIDEYGGPAGIVTLEDVVEELVGDIADEYDESDAGEHPLEEADGAWTVPGDWRVDEIERVTGVVLPDGDYDTVAGLVLERLEHIPDVGETVEIDGVEIEVLAVQDWAIEQVRLSVVEAPEGEGEGEGEGESAESEREESERDGAE